MDIQKIEKNIPELELTRRTTPDALRHAAQHWPTHEALIIGGTRLSYAQLYERVLLHASNLYRLGLRPGEHLAICMGNSAEWVITAYAANCIGAVIIPVNTRFKADELRYQLEQSDTDFLVVADRFLAFPQISRQIMMSKTEMEKRKCSARNMPLSSKTRQSNKSSTRATRLSM